MFGCRPVGGPICGHSGTMDPRSVGVEEELLLVEPETGRPQAVAGTVLHAAEQAADSQAGTGHDAEPELEFELQQQQLETSSRPCRSLSDLHGELRRCRDAAAAAAGRAGVQVAALATSPLEVEPELVHNQ